MLFHIRQHVQKVRVDFMRAVNQSSREGGLTCSFVDKEIRQFTIQEVSGQAPQEITFWEWGCVQSATLQSYMIVW